MKNCLEFICWIELIYRNYFLIIFGNIVLVLSLVELVILCLLFKIFFICFCGFVFFDVGVVGGSLVIVDLELCCW